MKPGYLGIIRSMNTMQYLKKFTQEQERKNKSRRESIRDKVLSLQMTIANLSTWLCI